MVEIDPRLSVARITAGGVSLGTGFLVQRAVLATAYHVLGSRDVADLTVHFPGLDRDRSFTVDAEFHVDRSDGDVMLLHLREAPAGAPVLRFGGSGSGKRPVTTFGFTRGGPSGGHRVDAQVLATRTATGRMGRELLQVQDDGGIASGFSGAPVIDDRSGLVIGILTDVHGTDAETGRLGIYSYATPSEVVLDEWPELTPVLRNPFHGLRTLGENDSADFHGREALIDEMRDRLFSSGRLLALLGPSGSGKSSALLAGLVPRIRASEDGLEVATIRPGGNPYAALAESGFLGGYGSVAEVVAARRRAGAGPCLLVVDQFEEILTQTADRFRDEFLRDLHRALDTHDQRFLFAMSARDDFYSGIRAAAPGLMQRIVPGIVQVHDRLLRADIRDIVTMPAEREGWTFEPGAAEQIVAQVVEGREDAPTTTLPLLQLHLEKLFASSAGSVITRDQVERSGGIGLALTDWADAALARVGSSRREIARALIMALVVPADPEGRTPAARTRRPRDEVVAQAGSSRASNEEIRLTLDALLESRLLTSSGEPEQERSDRETARGTQAERMVWIELVHEALISRWPLLESWMKDEAQYRTWLHLVETRARNARSAGEPDVLGQGQLEIAQGYMRRFVLPSDVASLVHRSRSRLVRQRRVRRTVIGLISTLGIIASAAGVVSMVQRRELATRADVIMAEGLASEARALAPERPELAALLAAEGLDRHPSPRTRTGAATVLASASPRGLTIQVGGTPTAMAVAPDQEVVAIALDDGRLTLWNRRTHAMVAQTPPAHGGINAVVALPAARAFATASDDGRIALWDATTADPLGGGSTGQIGKLLSLAVDPTGQTLYAGGSDRRVGVWDVVHQRQAREPIDGFPSSVISLTVSPDGTTLAAGCDDPSALIVLWDLPDNHVVDQLTDHLSAITTVSFMDDTTLVSGSTDRTLRLWNTEQRRPIGEPLDGHTGAVRAVTVAPGGTEMASIGDDETIRRWSLPDGQPLGPPLISQTSAGVGLSYVGDSGTLVSIAADGAWRIWATSDQQPTIGAALVEHGAPVKSVVFSPDGNRIAAAAADGRLRLWTTEGRRLVWSVRAHVSGASDLAFAPDGETLVSVDDTGHLRFSDAQTGAETGHAQLLGVKLWGVAVSPDGHLVAGAASDGTVPLWDPETGARVGELPGHEGQVDKVIFSPSGDLLASSGTDSVVRIWDLGTRRQVRVLEGRTGKVWGIAFSPDGTRIASAGEDGTIRVWTVADGKTQLLMRSSAATDGVAYSPDGRIIASTGADAAVRLWDAQTGDPLEAPLAGHVKWSDGLAFSPDGALIASSGSTGDVRLWSINPAAWPGLLCAIAGRNLTEGEWTQYIGSEDWRSTCPGAARPGSE